MMSAANRKTITDHLSRSNISPDNLISASGYYLLGLHLLQNIEGQVTVLNITRAHTNPKCEVFCKNFGLTSMYSDTQDGQVATIDANQNLFQFCESLVELGLDRDPYAYYDYLWPYLVCDGGTISKHCSNDPFKIACALHIAITAYLRKNDIPSNAVESYFIYSQHEEAFQMLDLTEDEFSCIWDSCFSAELAKPYPNWNRPAFTKFFTNLPKALPPPSDSVYSL